jgi:hypothetical protein
MKKVTEISEYFRKIPVPFLVAIISVLALILFLPDPVAKTLAIDEFRVNFRALLGPTLLLAVSFLIARFYIFLRSGVVEKKKLKAQQQILHKLTSHEKGYLIQFLEGQNTLYKGIDDGVMGGLIAKGIAYRSSQVGNYIDGFAHNLQPWAREYLEDNPT